MSRNFRGLLMVGNTTKSSMEVHDGNESATTGGRTQHPSRAGGARQAAMIRKLKSGGYRLYSRKINPKTGRRGNLGTFATRAAAEKHERAVQYFKRH
jgi:hypothetical protein